MQPISDVNDDLIGKCRVVLYDNDPYSVIIQDVDTDSCALVEQCTGLGPVGFIGQWRMM